MPSSSLRRLRVALEMAKAGQAHNARQIMHAKDRRRSAARAPVARARIGRAGNRRKASRHETGPGDDSTHDVRLEPGREYRRQRCAVEINEHGAHALDVVRLPAFAVGRVDGDENARALFLQRVELVGHAVKIAVHDAREIAPLRWRVVETFET